MRGVTQSHPVERNRSPDDPAVPTGLARAHVSVGLDVGLDVGPENHLEERRSEKRADVGAPRVEYRWPPVSATEERELASAYAALTDRRVPGGVMRLLILARRSHGPDTIPLLQRLHAAYGVRDLLLRLRNHSPRLDPHPDWAASTSAPPHVSRDHSESSPPARCPGPRRTGPQEGRRQPASGTANDTRRANSAAPTEPERRGPIDADESERPARTRVPGRRPINAPWDDEDLAEGLDDLPPPTQAGVNTAASAAGLADGRHVEHAPSREPAPGEPMSSHGPRPPDDPHQGHAVTSDAGPSHCGCAEADLLPGLVHCAAHRPPFNGTSKRRYDRRPSNPDAIGLIGDEELGATRPSPTARALGR